MTGVGMWGWCMVRVSGGRVGDSERDEGGGAGQGRCEEGGRGW